MTDPTELARRFGTPAYIYDLSAVRSAARALTADLPDGAGLLYSLKANPHPAIVQELAALGMGAEVSSPDELRTALTAGHTADQVLYTGPGKTPAEVATALAAGVRRFSVESPADRDRLAAACTAAGVDAEYLVRLNAPRGSAGGSLRMAGKPTAFGVDTADSAALTTLLRPSGRARPIGMHTFSATNIGDPDELLQEFEQSLAVCAQAAERADFVPQVLDLGGGFPAPSARPGELTRHPKLADGITRALAASFPGDDAPALVFESGRYLTAAAGTLLTTVVDIKHSGGKTFVVVDAGINVLGGMAGLGRLLRPSVQPETAVDGPGASSGDEALPVLVGPLCTPLDVLSTAVRLPEPRIGQILAVPNVGAYGLTASLLGFLSRPIPTEIVTDSGMVRSARRLSLRAEEVSCDG
ncbi:type III PLP-dependent enzyme [Streptomyces sp. GbtcB6]|uniref:type III PLP-dependent enzyme n=1 Tax=Streptomyces sp. GbtcB6 TaxID=2824751 RepID=UPI001C2F1BC8|nr:type III PLP-dependent enzyme [Streptomyces sp. GbtcB6]